MAQFRNVARITKLRSRPERSKKKKKWNYATANQPDEGVKHGLTSEQLEIVNLPPKDQALVTAGPGTGKTHVLIARLAYLVNQYGLQPGREVLVLSFSRAAVGEIRKRVKEAGGDVQYVRTYTFDSFATRLLSQVDPSGDWVEADYNGRIEHAIDQIRENNEAQRFIGGYAHILVDEIQDLVYPRVELLLTLLEAAPGGFTLLGDPAQGIYNFQLKDPVQRRLGSQLLYGCLRDEYMGSLQQFTLTKNHRVQTKVARSALGAGAKLNKKNPNYTRIAEELNSLVGRLPLLEELEEKLPALLSDGQSTAVLCRTNAQALLISRELANANIGHAYQRAATDRVIPPWVGIVLGTWNYGQIGKTAFTKQFQQKLNGQGPDPDEAWALLKRIEGQRGNTLDITAVSARIATGYVPDELNLSNSGQLTVSTIHRAKGLEFDRVVLVEPNINLNKDWIKISEETRLLYVALTRPRRDLLRIAAPDTRYMQRLGHDKRWARREYSWKLRSVEIKGQDIHSQDPAGGHLLKNSNPIEIQEYLREEVRPGDPVTLQRFSKSTSGQPLAFYSLEHKNRSIGITSERFANMFHSVIKVRQNWEVRWPAAITGIRVEAIDTVAGTVASGQNAGLNRTGLWLRARTAGLGHVIWS